MGRNKEEQARMEGMAQALRIAKAKGIDGLEADLKMRNITGLPCAVSRAAMDECIMNIKYNVVDTFTILVAYTLHEKFGFGKTRLNRFIQSRPWEMDMLRLLKFVGNLMLKHGRVQSGEHTDAKKGTSPTELLQMELFQRHMKMNCMMLLMTMFVV